MKTGVIAVVVAMFCLFFSGVALSSEKRFIAELENKGFFLVKEAESAWLVLAVYHQERFKDCVETLEKPFYVKKEELKLIVSFFDNQILPCGPLPPMPPDIFPDSGKIMIK